SICSSIISSSISCPVGNYPKRLFFFHFEHHPPGIGIQKLGLRIIILSKITPFFLKPLQLIKPYLLTFTLNKKIPQTSQINNFNKSTVSRTYRENVTYIITTQF